MKLVKTTNQISRLRFRSERKLRILSAWVVALLTCVACASRHELPPKAELQAQIESMREAVAEKVRDAPRAARLTKAIDGYETELLSFGTAFKTFRVKLLTLNSRPDATRAEFDALADAFARERIATRTRLIKLHLEMIAATTGDEWKGLAKHERAVLSVPPEY